MLSVLLERIAAAGYCLILGLPFYVDCLPMILWDLQKFQKLHIIGLAAIYLHLAYLGALFLTLVSLLL